MAMVSESKTQHNVQRRVLPIALQFHWAEADNDTPGHCHRVSKNLGRQVVIDC